MKSEHVISSFVIINRPDKVPIKKGPLKRDMVLGYLQSLRKHFPKAILTVAEITHDHDLWLTHEDDWLLMERIAASEGHSPSCNQGAGD